MKKEGGFTLIELMVVIAIVVILLSWAVPRYSNWKAKHDIENQILQLHSDIQLARMTAYSRKVVSGIWWGGGANFSQYQIRCDGNDVLNPGTWVDTNTSIDDALGAGGDTQLGAAVQSKAPIVPSAAVNSVAFDGRGFSTNSLTFSIANTIGAALDCVQVDSTRIFMGKMNAGNCTPR